MLVYVEKGERGMGEGEILFLSFFLSFFLTNKLLFLLFLFLLFFIFFPPFFPSKLKFHLQRWQWLVGCFHFSLAARLSEHVPSIPGGELKEFDRLALP